MPAVKRYKLKSAKTFVSWLAGYALNRSYAAGECDKIKPFVKPIDFHFEFSGSLGWTSK